MMRKSFYSVGKQHLLKDMFLVVVFAASIITSFATYLHADTPKPVNKEPVRLLFDTDIGGDIDDALALALIHGLQNQGECKLLAVTCTGWGRYDAPYVDLVNAFYGRKDIPVGSCSNQKLSEEATYTRFVATSAEKSGLQCSHQLQDGCKAPDAVTVLRKALAAQPDVSVVIAQVGSSANLAKLLDSKPDQISPLDGMALVKQKVKLFCPMAGYFGPKKDFPECNVVADVKAAQKVFEKWPTSLVASGWEVGDAIHYPWRSIVDDYRYVALHPVAEAYKFWAYTYPKGPHDRPTWDLTSVLYLVRPDAGCFGLSPEGRITVEKNGVTVFRPEAGGLHRYLTVTTEQVSRDIDIFTSLCSSKPLQVDASSKETTSTKQ